MLSRAVAHVDPDTDTNVIGSRPGAVDPPLEEGRAVRRSGEVVVDKSLKLSVGDDLELGGATFEVVGIGDGLRYNFGAPTALLTLRDAQALSFEGNDFVMAVPVAGRVDALPDGFITLTNDDVPPTCGARRERQCRRSTSSATCCGSSPPGSSARSCT